MAQRSPGKKQKNSEPQVHLHDQPHWTYEDVAVEFDVSHETLALLKQFVELLGKWQKSINLIGPGTLKNIWGRHIADSLQIAGLASDDAKLWLDLGSGGGLPGMVVAIALRDRAGFKMHLVESNGKKAAFLGVAARAMGVPVEVHNCRIESLAEREPPLRADVISARALAPLPQLMDLSEAFMWKKTVCLFPKGQDVESELTASARFRRLSVVRVPSVVDGSGTILRIEGATSD